MANSAIDTKLRETINKKREIAERASPNYDIYKEMSEQILICEELSRPLSEKQIKEYVQLPLFQMQRKIKQHKFA